MPSPPVNATATVSSGRISLAWSKPQVAGSGPVTGYEILRSSSGSGGSASDGYGQGFSPLTTVPSGSTTFTDNTVVPGGTYFYELEALTQYGNSQLSCTDGDNDADDCPAEATDAPANAPDITTLMGNQYLGPSPFKATQLGQEPGAVAVQGTTAYLADDLDHTIRAVNLKTGVETLLAGNATSVQAYAFALAIDASGNLVFPQAGDNIAEMVALTTSDRLMPGKTLVKGDLYTIGGNGHSGFSGDGGPAVNGSLDNPRSVALDQAGNLLVGDNGNHRIRLIAAATWSPLLPHRALRPGFIYTAVGNGTAPQADVGDNGPATKAEIDRAESLTVDRAGNLLIGDNGIEDLRLVAGSGSDPLLPGMHLLKGDIYYLAGTPIGGGTFKDLSPATQTRLTDFSGLTTTPSGDLLIADGYEDEVRLIATGPSDPLVPGHTLKKGYVYPVVDGSQASGYAGDGGPALNAKLGSYQGSIALDGAGNLFISDYSNSRLREVSSATGIISTISGNGTSYWDGVPASQSPLYSPEAVSTDANGDIIITDSHDDAVRVIPKSNSLAFLPGKTLVPGDIYTVAGTGAYPVEGEGLREGQPATSTAIAPMDATVDPSGNLLIAEDWWPDIRLVAGSTSDPLLHGQKLVKGDMYDLAGGNGSYGYPTSGTKAVDASLLEPRSLTTDKAGNLYFSMFDRDYSSYVVMVAAGTGSPYLPGQKLTAGNLYIVAGSGNSGYSGDGGPATQAELNRPHGLAIDASGNLTVDDYWDSVVRLIAGSTSDSLLPAKSLTAGDIYTLAGGGTSYDYGIPATQESIGPSGVALDPSGNLAISDNTNNVVWLDAATSSDPLLPGATLTPGDLYKVAGYCCYSYDDGNPGYTADGGPAVTAKFSDLVGLSFDAAGDLFLADDSNSVVREIKVGTGASRPPSRPPKLRTQKHRRTQRSMFNVQRQAQCSTFGPGPQRAWPSLLSPRSISALASVVQG